MTTNNELCVPAGAVSAAGEDGSGVAPGVGDEVEVTIRGPVSRVEGDQIYLTPASANGEPIAMGGDDDGGAALGEDEEMDRVVAGYRTRGGGAGAMGAMLGLVLALLVAVGGGAQQVKEANRRDKNITPTNNWVAAAVPTQAFSVSVYNSGSSTVYLMVFDSATNQLVNAKPSFAAIKVPANETWGWDWSANGVPFDYGINACISTTPITLTNASAVGEFVVVRREPK